MKTNNLFTLPLMALAATALTSCWDDDEKVIPEPIDPNAGKEMIAFTTNGGEAITRASLEGTRAGFESKTKIELRFKAEDLKEASGYTKQPNRYTHTYAVAEGEVRNDGNEFVTDDHNTNSLLGTTFAHSEVEFTSENKRYWDDAFGRYSQLSVFAICVPNYNADGVLPNNSLNNSTYKTDVNSESNPNWFTEYNTSESTEDEVESVTWKVTTGTQTDESILKEDLCHSRNIRVRELGSDTSDPGVYRKEYSSGSGEWNYVSSMPADAMKWQPQDGAAINSTTSTAGKFDQGHMVFRHSLCKITVNLTEGSGFNTESKEDFAFTTGTVKLIDMPTNGTLNILSNSWTITSSEGVKQMHETTSDSEKAKNTKVRQLQAIVLPTLDLYNTESNVIEFTIDNNKYYVTGKTIAEKIRKYAVDNNKSDRLKGFTTMTMGDHYVINITVKKTEIENITAALVEWESVPTAEIPADNTYVTFTLEERNNRTKITPYTESHINKFDIYRAKQTSSKLITDSTEPNYIWNTGYLTGDPEDINNSEKAEKDYVTDATNGDHWTTKWYWPDNYTYYHFRIAGNAATDNDTPVVKTDKNGTEDNTSDDIDYFEIKSGKIDGSDGYNDYTWGAPFYLNHTDDNYNLFDYTTNDGFAKKKNGEYQISKALGASYDRIKFLLYHMTSQIFINVQTVDKDRPDHVVLHTSTNDTKVEILRCYTNGRVQMGNGLVYTSGDLDTDGVTTEFKNYYATEDYSSFEYGVVPQPLKGQYGDPKIDYTVGIRITTPDGNQYVIEDISDVLATSVSTNNISNPYSLDTDKNKFIVDQWYPCYQYTYTVTLKKTGIDNITASLVEWEEVHGDLGEITLEGTN